MKNDPWQALDKIAQQCASTGTADWNKEHQRRSVKRPRPMPNDEQMLRHFAVAIAYSQGAPSAVISKLIGKAVFASAFKHFKIKTLSATDPQQLLDRYWSELSAMRFRGKVDSIVRCAQVLASLQSSHGNFSIYLKSFAIPRRLKTDANIDRFWTNFDKLRIDLVHREMPFFKSTTSLLQLLLDLDYDSVKPDLIVMRLAKRIGLIESETGDRHLRFATRSIQEYALKRNIRPPLVDLQLLAHGGQTGARKLLNERFCLPAEICQQHHCTVGSSGFCSAYNRSRDNNK